MPEGVKLIGYADDLAIVIVARDEDVLKRRANKSVKRVMERIEKNGIALVPKKSESVLLIGRKKVQKIDIQIGGSTLQTSESLRYLGVYLQRNLRQLKLTKLNRRLGQWLEFYQMLEGQESLSEKYCVQLCTP